MEGNRGDVSAYAKLFKGDSKCIYNINKDFYFQKKRKERKEN